MRVNIADVVMLVRNATCRGFPDQTRELLETLIESMVCIDKCEELIGDPTVAVERLNQTMTVLASIIGELKNESFSKFRDFVHQTDGPTSRDKFRLCIFIHSFRHLCLAKHMLDLDYGDQALNEITLFWKDVRTALNQ